MGLANRCLLERLGDEPGRCFELCDHEAFIEREIVDDGPSHSVRHPLSHLLLGVHHEMGTNPLEDPPVLGRDGLGPHVRYTDINKS